MARVRTVEHQVSCAICQRTLLMGESATRYSPGRDEWVDVCPLCSRVAAEHGWIKEGAPTTPLVAERRRRLRVPVLPLLERRHGAEQPAAAQPALVVRPLSDGEQALAEAAELFNGSAFRRTVAGIAKSLGTPQASLVYLSGVNPEVVITVAWEISWYQYRVVFGSGQPIRLAERGFELEELDERFTAWNGRFDEETRLIAEA
jgi:hypothetical protein